VTYAEWLHAVADEIVKRGYGARIEMRRWTTAGPVFSPSEALVVAVRDDGVHMRMSSAYDVATSPAWYAGWVLQSITWTREDGEALIAQFLDIPSFALTKSLNATIVKSP